MNWEKGVVFTNSLHIHMYKKSGIDKVDSVHQELLKMGRHGSICYGVRLYNVPERYSEIASDYSKRSDS